VFLPLSNSDFTLHCFAAIPIVCCSGKKWKKVCFCGVFGKSASFFKFYRPNLRFRGIINVFQGSQSINVDVKGRMAIPSRYRDMLAAACEGRLVVTASPYERCLYIYPEHVWKEKKAQIEAMPNSNKQVRRMQRLVLGNASELEMDGNGRLLLPSTLRDFASLDKKAVLVGLGEKAELWSEKSWNEMLDETDDEPMPEEMNNLSL